MIHTLAQAAVTVTETVTNAPSPTVPVEIIKQPSSGWEAKDVTASIISGLSSVVSIVAVYFSLKSWKMQGPVAKIRFQEYSPELGTWLSISNVGRETGLLEKICVSAAKEYDWCVLAINDFSFADEPDNCKMLAPGEFISGEIPIRDFALAMEDSDSPLRKIGIQVRFAGEERKIKLPRKVRKKLKPYVLKDRQEVKKIRAKHNVIK